MKKSCFGVSGSDCPLQLGADVGTVLSSTHSSRTRSRSVEASSVWLPSDHSFVTIYDVAPLLLFVWEVLALSLWFHSQLVVVCCFVSPSIHNLRIAFQSNCFRWEYSLGKTGGPHLNEQVNYSHIQGIMIFRREGNSYKTIIGVVLLYWCVSWLAIGMNKSVRFAESHSVDGSTRIWKIG